MKECTCPATVLTKERIEKFSSRARAYICTYHHLEQCASRAASECTSRVAVALGVASTTLVKKELLYTQIERLSKAFKGRRCALDFDRGFVNSHLKERKHNDE